MKIVLISNITPAVENIRATSALPYHLLLKRDAGIELTVYSYNFNELNNEQIRATEEGLRAKVVVMEKPKWIMWVLRFHLLFLRLFLPYPLHNYVKLSEKWLSAVKAENPDEVIIYGAEMSRVNAQLKGYRRKHILPDCTSLYYFRMMGKRFVFTSKKYWNCVFMYRKFLNMERNFPSDDNVTYYLVGEEDRNHLQEVNPEVKAVFFRHPHYDITYAKKEIHFSQPKIKLLVAGQYNYYMQQDADALVEELVRTDKKGFIAEHYEITFLGKGWEESVVSLQVAGYDVKHIRFAPNYTEEVAKHDIQMTPISIGTGTKGKVLDALANGLLVMGTQYAMENIAVENGVSCVLYDKPEGAIEILKDIPGNIRKYEVMAEAGRRDVLEYHGRERVAEEFFGG